MSNAEASKSVNVKEAEWVFVVRSLRISAPPEKTRKYEVEHPVLQGVDAVLLNWMLS